MPIRYLTADAVRDAEHAAGDLLADGTLMRRASHGVAQVVIDELRRTGGCYGRQVGIVVGAGDNGGDALYAGAALSRRGVACTALLLAPDRAHREGLAAFRRTGGRIVETLAGGLDVVIDGVVGIGGHGPLRPAAAEVFGQLTGPADGGPIVVAVDIPSGVDADTGQVHDPAVRATVTVTFGAPRNAHLLAATQCGRTVTVDIGIDPTGTDGDTLSSLTDHEVAALWPVPGPADDKYSQGVVGVIAGSARYPGAAILATGAAVSATSGMTRYVGTAADEVVAHFPEVVATRSIDDAGRVQAWAVGPGIGTDDDALGLLRDILSTDLPVLVDADGLTLVARHPELVDRRAPTLLTPHAGEFARLTGDELGPDRLAAVRDLARRWGVSVLLKGRITLVADPDGAVLGNDAGSSWAATAGAGDVLSGIAGSLLAAGLTSARAGAAAARVHAHAAELAARDAPIGASDLLAAVRPAIRALRRGHPTSATRAR
ncbi:NAD(P)H-hydrate dehydratase [Gordonia sp. PKS22-38]|uniref:Bifunctional NAD(P)H-hydrate repair enzyme n=1 Tax=Gordonia prachuapensis TaxID=3115651 RepID=A0ABU7MPW6_9ACTN|nr:NAD(P)H-hydrate dehydratase [Gordonia sp. PKS22-38]